MSKFWQKKYTSKYTGAEIDAAVAKAGNLPATTSADAGKALVVDEEGKIVAGETGGGKEDFVVTFTLDMSDDTATCDKTYSAVTAAFADKNVIFKISTEYMSVAISFYSDNYYVTSGLLEGIYVNFFGIVGQSTKMYNIKIANDDTITVNAKTITTT